MEQQLDVYTEWLGIPEGDRPPDHYELLRLVQFDDDTNRIRDHYKKLNTHVRKYATGKYSVRSQELLNELAKAMLCLTDPERKREYDESLGRVFEEAATEGLGKPLAKVLIDWGKISSAQAKELNDFAEKRGLTPRDAAVQMKLVDIVTATQAFAEELRRPYVDLDDMLPDDSLLDQIPRSLVKHHTILPLFVDDDVVLVACADDPSPELEDELRLRLGVAMRPVITQPRSINQAIAKYYAPGMRDESVAENAGAAKVGKRRKVKKPKAALSSDEQYQATLIQRLICCWAVIGSVLLDTFVIKAYLLPRSFSFPYILSLFAIPIAGYFFYRTYK